MIWVHYRDLPRKPRLAPSPFFPELPFVDEAERLALVARLSLWQCATVDEMVLAQARFRGLWRLRVGSPLYCALEERVMNEILALELDLDEIGARIEEAKWEAECFRDD